MKRIIKFVKTKPPSMLSEVRLLDNYSSVCGQIQSGSGPSQYKLAPQGPRNRVFAGLSHFEISTPGARFRRSPNPATPDGHWAGGESWWSWRMRACAQPCRACCAESKMHTHAGRLLCHRPGAACHAAAKRRPATIGFEQGPNLLSNQFSVF